METNHQFGEFTLDPGRGCLLKNGVEIKLRPKVYETLKYLVEHPGRLISKQELMQAVWPDAFVTDDSLVQCTLELRRALGDRNQILLKTVPRRGYIFSAEVVKGQTKAGPVADPDFLGLPERMGLAAEKAVKRRHDLPVPWTSFVGREQQINEVVSLLQCRDIRLLTMTGPGGSGKTRLAIAAAHAMVETFTAGAQFVSLASITNPALVATAIAEALKIQQVANRTIAQLIGEQLLDSGPFLLILDNFEQVLQAATVIAETLEACPQLKILVTSRSCLHIYGEQEFPVTPLAEDSAIKLFAERAAAVWPDFAITAENASSVKEICSRVDGLPLAIELAAARTKMLSPGAILDRLQSRLQLLTGGALDLPERHQTLRNTIDWSHGLLSESERKLLRRISVFVGGCTLEAAEAVCDTNQDLGIDLFEGLSSLVDKNLVQRVDRAEAEARFGMLETIREYGLIRLKDSGEEPAVRRAHAAYCLVLAEEGNPELSSAERSRWLAQCDAEADNLRSALDWLFQTQDLDWSLRMCAGLFLFWDMREHLSEGRARLESVMRMAGSERTKDRARVAMFLGALSTSQGDYPAGEYFLHLGLTLYEGLEDHRGIAAALNALAISGRDHGDYAAAQSYFERSLDCWRLLNDQLAIARCLHNMANVVKVRGDYPRARWALGEATVIFEKLGDRSGAAWSLNQQGDIARAQGDMATAAGLYERALKAFREVGDPWGSARSLTDLAYIEHERGNHAAAHAGYHEALEIFTSLGHRRGMARALEGCACLAMAQSHAERALRLAASAAHLRHVISAPLTLAEQSRLDQTLLPAWESLSESESKKAWDEGTEMSLEKAIQYSLEGPDKDIDRKAKRNAI